MYEEVGRNEFHLLHFRFVPVHYPSDLLHDFGRNTTIVHGTVSTKCVKT